MINTRRDDLYKGKLTSEQLYKGYVLCSKHFEDSQFMNADEKKSLIHNAVPTIFDEIPNPPQCISLKRKLPEYHPDDVTLTRPPKRQKKEGEK